MSHSLVRYDAMCRAIAAAYDIDEVKDIRDKARAIEVYAKQAKNVEAERQACEIRLRAERKCGILLREKKERGEMAKGGAPYHKHTPYTVEGVETEGATLRDLRISERQSHDWQKLGGVAEEDFEAALTGPVNPTTHGIIAAHTPSPERDALKTKALWLWGRLQDFEREGLFDEHPADLLAVMSDHMRATTLELTPIVIEWLEDLTNER